VIFIFLVVLTSEHFN